MKIYTRRGDDGTTGLIGGVRVSKAHPRVDAYGTVDELNSLLGWVRASCVPDAIDLELAHAQACLFELGASLATPDKHPAGAEALREGDIDRLEASIDVMEASLKPLKSFVLPGGNEAASRLHVARTECRRVERLLVALAESEELDPLCIRWMNRLSDMLFVAARYANHEDGVDDDPWTARSDESDAHER